MNTQAQVGVPDGNVPFELFYADLDWQAMARKAWSVRASVPRVEGVNTPQEVVVIVASLDADDVSVHYTSHEVVGRMGALQANLDYMSKLLFDKRPFVYVVCEFASFIMELTDDIPTEAAVEEPVSE